MKKVAIIMGSDSDLTVAMAAAEVLRAAGAPHVMRVMSAHRTPEVVGAFASSASAEGFGVVIAIAGKAAHLAGSIASATVLPVIGVPVSSAGLGGLDALLSTVQMPSGVPVAAVAIDGGANAAWLALSILALNDERLTQYLLARREAMAQGVAAKDAALQAKLEGEA